VVAGGGSGIGAATALRLAVEGCTVVVGDVAVEGAARVSEEIAGAGGTATGLEFDLGEPQSNSGLITGAASACGGVDLLSPATGRCQWISTIASTSSRSPS
jgi:NAD(P)-dependent dehydrogenase (short-subunit alcohol dehydrogenase family)